jgi:hypothetical protein
VVFLKERDFILTNEEWRVALDLKSAYREVISAIRGDVASIQPKERFHFYF